MFANVLKKYLIYLHKYSDLMLWDSKLSSGASCFHWSSLRLESTCGKFNWLDIIWKSTQLTVLVRATTKQWGWRNSAPIKDSVAVQIWGRVPKISIWNHQDSTKIWPPGQTEQSGEKGLRSGRWPRTRWWLWQSSRVPLWRWQNLPEGQPFLQHSTNRAFMVEWPDRSHSSVKGADNPLGVCQKAPNGLRPWEWWNLASSLW